MVEAMEVKVGFEKTDIGIYPVDWNIKELGEILQSTQLGGNYANSDKEAEYVLIKMGNLGRGYIELKKRHYIQQGIKPAETDKVYYGDVLFNTRNTLALVGKVAIWKNELPLAYFNSNIMRFVFKTEDVSSNFFMNFILNTKNSLYQLRGIATGTTSVAAIYTRDLIKIKVPVPTKAEQTAIATALNDADALTVQLEKLIAKKRNIKQGAMQDLLTGRKRLPGFEKKGYIQTVVGTIPSDWEVEKLNKVCTLSKKRINPITSNMNLKCVELEHLSQVTGRLLGFTDSNGLKSQKTVFNKGDVLLGKLRPYLKKYLFADFDGVCTTEIWVLKPSNEVVNNWLYYSVQSNRILDAANQTEGTKMPRADWKIVGETLIPLPPTKAEQTAIAQILSDMDTETEALEKKLEKYKMVKQGMMQNLLTGKIRLV
jgi:type I restriction enzyme S subunit